MTITVSNKLGGQKIGDSTYSYANVRYGFSPQTFTGDDATKQAQFQFDLERPTHCLLENNLADVIDRSANCTVFPIALDEDITSVSLSIFYVVEHYTCMFCTFLGIRKLAHFHPINCHISETVQNRAILWKVNRNSYAMVCLYAVNAVLA